MTTELSPLIVLNGPTASGKSALAIAVAQALTTSGRPAEVINSDSMLVYRGMDIGTAKPTVAERAGIPHHLIDIYPVTQQASVAEFQTLARAAIDDCRRRGVVPVLAGGSALYVHAIIDEFSFPGTDPQVRDYWQRRLDQIGAPSLHAELAAKDPQAAAQILPGNGRRIVRALEIFQLTGTVTPVLPQWSYALDNVRQFGLDLPREVLDERVNSRVDDMWRQGLVDEVRALEAVGLRDGVTASRALGYRQVLQFLDGEVTQDQARELTASGTRKFVRKQLGWLRRDPRIQWLSDDARSNLDQVLSGII